MKKKYFKRKKNTKRLNFKKRLMLPMTIALFLFQYSTLTVSAQDNPWIFGLYTHGFHFLTGNLLSIAKQLVNIPIANATDGAAPFDFVPFNLHYMSFKDNGENVDYKMGNPYGFTSYDLFNDVEAGVKIGWQGAESPVGAYLYGAYSINQHKLRFLGEHDYSKHKIQSWKAGIGVRISPLRFLMNEYDWCPIIELGTTYVYNFKYKGPNGSDIDQLNNGMRMSYAVGAQFDEGDQSVMICLDMAHYNLFNKNYTPDGGFWFPYANFKNKDFYFSVRYSISLDALD